MSREAFSHYLFYKKKVDDSITFEHFFKKFWENAKVVYRGHSPKTIDSGITEIEEIRKNNPEKCLYDEIKYFARNDLDFYNQSPFLSLAQDLLNTVREGYVKEIVFTTLWAKPPAGLKMTSEDLEKEGDPRKRRRFENSFGKLPQCTMEINIPWEKDQKGEFIEVSRADWIKEYHPDFDIFIDDNLNTMKKVRKNHGADKVCVIPNTTENFPKGCLLVSVNVISLKDEDFVYQANQWEQTIEILPKVN